ncbi:MAG: Lipopolysaccharide biosynthesis glycosyltransferase [Candidatus Roizmanbacteria bacterium GW2011_GWA2_35_8]|uniref:Lipopolysaccharide biosynthesis glycosyltransferase n=1 Tax=Candidatus Roizmanbacteria bacterium GW2011_GWA2_35_8 TaxID=1618479 RepID=A0A0G0DCL4_9BACT|nr:MAG: Lipopolysaccharide biosynthesis glycosyltransferase [Candidatus Roizmanbacteria bacterium GW2011_GWA2_35_8]
MKDDISAIMITKNAESTIENSLKSVSGWVREIIVVDSYSTDKTLEIAKFYNTKIFVHNYEGEGKQRNFALSKARSNWILVLDADESVTLKLKNEVLKTTKSTKLSGFNVPIQSHYKKRKLNYGGENYRKMILFKRHKGKSTLDEIHAVCQIHDKKVGVLKNPLNHFSYNSYWQVLKKFTSYSFRAAKVKAKKNESPSLKKVFIYPIHMFYARFIKDEGYKDGLFRIPLDLAFAYMEFLTYFILLCRPLFDLRGRKRAVTKG